MPQGLVTTTAKRRNGMTVLRSMAGMPMMAKNVWRLRPMTAPALSMTSADATPSIGGVTAVHGLSRLLYSQAVDKDLTHSN